MSVFSTNEHMIKLYYSSKSSAGKQALGYMQASEKDQLAIDIEKTKVTGTQWKEIAEQLNKGIGDLIDKDHPAFTKRYDEHTSLEEDDWIKILQKHPEVLAYPVLIINETFYQIDNPSHIEHLLENDSKGIDEKKHI